jgi:mannose-1-phosphate guanylyltransferase
VPSDHITGDVEAFFSAVRIAAPVAREGKLVTFRIRPDRAETGYGYKAGTRNSSRLFRSRAVRREAECVVAAEFLADGFYDWNAGIFLFRADRYLDASAVNAPAILAVAQAAMEAAPLRTDAYCPIARVSHAHPLSLSTMR